MKNTFRPNDMAFRTIQKTNCALPYDVSSVYELQRNSYDKSKKEQSAAPERRIVPSCSPGNANARTRRTHLLNTKVFR